MTKYLNTFLKIHENDVAFFPVNIHHIIPMAEEDFISPEQRSSSIPAAYARERRREREHACIDLADALLHTYTTSRRFYDYIHFLSVLTGTHGKRGEGVGGIDLVKSRVHTVLQCFRRSVATIILLSPPPPPHHHHYHHHIIVNLIKSTTCLFRVREVVSLSV